MDHLWQKDSFYLTSSDSNDGCAPFITTSCGRRPHNSLSVSLHSCRDFLCWEQQPPGSSCRGNSLRRLPAELISLPGFLSAPGTFHLHDLPPRSISPAVTGQIIKTPDWKLIRQFQDHRGTDVKLLDLMFSREQWCQEWRWSSCFWLHLWEIRRIYMEFINIMSNHSLNRKKQHIELMILQFLHNYDRKITEKNLYVFCRDISLISCIPGAA